MRSSWLYAAILGGTAWLVCGCSRSGPGVNLGGPPEVLVAEPTQQDVPIIREWIGSLDGSINADVRARVSGYLISQDYKDGAVVQAGDPLFRIDPTTYEAAVEQAKAALTQAEANQVQSEQNEKREVELFERKVESQQARDNAVQANAASKAEVKAQQAAVRQAELNLQFTKVTAPVPGIAGIASPGIGDLVGPSDAQPLTTISKVDPIRAYFQLSEQDYLKLAKRVEEGRAAGEKPPSLSIILADGSTYAQEGKFLAVDREVDQQTGTIRLAALFPNPGNILRPGQFVRVRVPVRTLRGALLIPQRAVTELQTSYQIAVVGPENKAEIRDVQVGDRVGSLWVIIDGLKPGERVIVEGMQRLRQGEPVKPVPWVAPSLTRTQ
ncbi:MAG: efflux RND transporter periplasmic adaptor subunit [Verrucomicrobia bacterium]|nr:efflux RND transporter periplasmic adaptor subunit [Verrucomicrobiota bacterium]